ncbi:hypothetical protein [Arsenophonus nasoniae]|uniref:hypothetical protein n=2 Tax=Arsenophonus nasoniae TaxID=638 RepID=UPI0038793CBF
MSDNEIFEMLMKMTKNHMLTFRYDDLEQEFIMKEIKRLEKETGLRIRATDVIRIALQNYEQYLVRMNKITETKISMREN